MFAEARFNRSTDASEHLLGGVGILAIGIKLQILVKRIGCAVGRNHLVALQSRLANHVDTLPVVGIRALRVDLDRLVERRNRVVNLTSVGENRALIEVIGRSIRRLSLGGSVPLGDCLVSLARLRQGVS